MRNVRLVLNTLSKIKIYDFSPSETTRGSLLKGLLLFSPISIEENKDLLLTEREGRTGEYWPEVATVRTDKNERGPVFSSTARAG